MRYSVTRLCGGKALMVSPRDIIAVDMDRAYGILSGTAEMKSRDEMMIVMSWKGMEVTVYAQGKIMFHPLDDRDTAVSYANELLSIII
jgi:hypothetical protein